MKILQRYAMAIITGLWITGCASFLNPLNVTEDQLEGYMREQVTRFDQQQLKTGLPLSVKMKEADITIGPEGKEVVQLAIGGEVAVNALLTKIPVDVFLKVEGTPVLVASERAVYIKRLSLLDSRIDSTFFKGDFKPVTDTLMRAVAQMLETMPVYRIPEDNMAGRMLSLTDMQIKVVPGKLLLVSGD